MIKKITLFICWLISYQGYSQLYGALGPEDNVLDPSTYNNYGLIYTSNGAPNNFTVLKDFKMTHDGEDPVATPLTKCVNGKIYGVTLNSSIGEGIIYSFNPTTDQYELIKRFTNVNDGRNPSASVIQHSNGKLYGTTRYGGVNNQGVIFEIDPSTDTYLKLYDFAVGVGGFGPKYGVLESPDGKLRGVCIGGGVNSTGVIFSFDVTTLSYTAEYSFPVGSSAFDSWVPAVDANGILYIPFSGNTGNFNNGMLFAYNPTLDSGYVVHHFQSATGSFPATKCIFHGDTIIGMTSDGGASNFGVIYGINMADTSYMILHHFPTSSFGVTGPNIKSELVLGPDDMYYFRGGIGSNTCIAQYNPSTNAVSVHYIIPNTNFFYGNGVMFYDANTIFLASPIGGSYEEGEFIKINFPATTTERKFSFFESKDGKDPNGYLFIGTDGKLTGNTFSGGQFNGGVIFKYDLQLNTYEVIKSFDLGFNGFQIGGIVEGKSGVFYGYSQIWDGTIRVYEYNSNNDSLRFIYSGNDLPNNSPFRANNGKIYGCFTNGGANGFGYIYCYDPVVNVFTNIFNFNSSNGSLAQAKLAQDKDGFIYGTTRTGGTFNKGVIFSISPYTHAVTIVNSFTDFDGGTSSNTLNFVYDFIYAAGRVGGSGGFGSIYYCDPNNSFSFTNKYAFNTAINGRLPIGKVWFDNADNAYLTTSSSGTAGKGTLVRFNVVSNLLTKLYDFNTTNLGDYPRGDMHYSCAGEAMIEDTVTMIEACIGENLTLTTNANGTGLLYQWYLNGLPVVNAISSSLNLTNLQTSDIGDYHCVVSNSCGFKIRPLIKISLCNSIIESKLPGITLTKFEELNYFSVSSDKEISIQVFDLSGKVVLQTKLLNGEGEYDISSYSPGIYIISIQDLKSGSGMNEKFVLR